MKAPAEMFHEMDSLVQGEIMNKKCLSSSKIFLKYFFKISLFLAALDHAPVAHAASLLSAQSSLEKMLPQGDAVGESRNCRNLSFFGANFFWPKMYLCYFITFCISVLTQNGHIWPWAASAAPNGLNIG